MIFSKKFHCSKSLPTPISLPLSSISPVCRLCWLFLTIIAFSSVVTMVDSIPRVGAGGSSKFQTSKYSLSKKCSDQDMEAIYRCEKDTLDDWDVRDIDYNTPTRRFCCYIWNSLDCEIRIAERCDPNYASSLAFNVEQTYGSVCEYHSRRSASCALRWWSIMLIVLGGLLIISVILFVFYRKRQSKFTSEYSAVDSRLEYMRRQQQQQPTESEKKATNEKAMQQL